MKIYLFIAIASTFCYLMKLAITSLLGAGDVDGASLDHDAPLGHDAADASIKLLSFDSILAFLMGFGWAGVFAVSHGLSVPLSMLAAALVGMAMMMLAAFLMAVLLRLQQENKWSLADAVGKVGSVYLTLSDREHGLIHVEISGQIREVKAISKNPETIKTGYAVRVLSADSDRLVVEKA